MAARKKPADQRSPRTRSGDLQLVTASAPVDSGSPPHPAHWHADTVAEWDALFASKLASYLAPTDHVAVSRLFELYDERRRLALAARKQPYIEGSQGQPVLNPALAQIASIDQRVLQLEDRIGLSPKARLGLGIQLGEAAKSLDSLNRLMSDQPAPKRARKEPAKPPMTDPRFGTVVDADAR